MTPVRAAAIGLTLMAVMALWWLPGVADCLRSGTSPAPLAGELLAGLLTLRLLAVCLLMAADGAAQPSWFAVRTTSNDGLARIAASTLLCAMAWPLVLLAQWSSVVPALYVIAAETALLLVAAALALLSASLQRLPVAAQGRRALGLLTATVAASLLWSLRGGWLAWLHA